MAMHVTIAGGGLGAVEALIGLRELAGDRVRTTLVAPEPFLTLRPQTTLHPFTGQRPPSYPLADLVARLGGELRRDALAEVDPERHVVRTAAGLRLPYGKLVVAVGAKAIPPFPHALTFGVPGAARAMQGLLAELSDGRASSAAFVVPGGLGWTLPLYELALMTRALVDDRGRHPALTIVTPESAPLQIFGPSADAPIRELLARADIAFAGGAYVDRVEPRRVVLRTHGERTPDAIPADRAVTLPVPRGREIAGLPHDRDGFLPVDDRGRVRGVEDVDAVGDATDFPVKQGGLATQMADAAVEQLAAEAGAAVAPKPFRPVLRGKLLTGRGAEFLTSTLTGGAGAGEASPLELWSPPGKITGRHLAPWLARLEGERAEASRDGGGGERAAAPAEPYVEIEQSLPAERSAWPLELDPYSPVPADGSSVSPRGRH